ncbi:MAG: 50S ribosomal protein L10 [Candidatus Moranbacteria bacterium]|nr:50S ribosomal protein L10 [Candidatus Moranbacteria bacterium]
MLKRADKEKIVEKIKAEIENSQAVVFTDYQGLEANELNELRDQLFQNQINFTVYKKRLIQIALKNLKIDADIQDYKGPVAMASSSVDQVSCAKNLYQFSQKHKDLNMISGILEQKYLSSQQMIELAKLPSRQELIAQTVGTIKAPINGLVGALNAVNRSIVQVLTAIRDAK